SGDEYFEPYEVTKGGTYYDDLCEVPPGQNYKALTAWAGYPNPKFIADKRFWSFLLKLSPDKPSWTITAQPGPWVGPFHWENRRLRVPEIAALQTFPEDYIFKGSRRSVQKQIGNAVPCLMGAAMIEYVKESLM
ncbi:MAG: DNA cytosine methyltransferase, partial [Veillonella sp.]|nr:DNA cytosine methyltransferase [Veillonella sp.]